MCCLSGVWSGLIFQRAHRLHPIINILNSLSSLRSDNGFNFIAHAKKKPGKKREKARRLSLSYFKPTVLKNAKNPMLENPMPVSAGKPRAGKSSTGVPKFSRESSGTFT
jgi:hypothetical protein